VHEFTRPSSVRSVVRVTGNYTSETPLHPAAMDALQAAFEQGWADPKKISQSAARAAILRNQSLENIASRLGLSAGEIEIIGEPTLGHYLGIAGFLHEAPTFAFSATDKGKIRALARSASTDSIEYPVSQNGHILIEQRPTTPTVLSLQLANSETGVIQELAQNEETLASFSHIAVDATASGPRLPLPPIWSSALFDALSWGGPGGLGVLAIRSSSYKYPLPHLAPIKTPGSYSLPLLIAAAVALENFQEEDHSLRDFAVQELSSLKALTVIAPTVASLPHKLSLIVEGVAGEQLVRVLDSKGISIDSGSACSPADLQPSHVLAAMGYPTTGHLRLTLHGGVTVSDIHTLKSALENTLVELSR
jgi:cysteine desulfurase